MSTKWFALIGCLSLLAMSIGAHAQSAGTGNRTGEGTEGSLGSAGSFNHTDPSANSNRNDSRYNSTDNSQNDSTASKTGHHHSKSSSSNTNSANIDTTNTGNHVAAGATPSSQGGAASQ